MNVSFSSGFRVISTKSRASVLIQLGVQESLEPGDMEPSREATAAGKKVNTGEFFHLQNVW
jgi:hypothetical protein